MTIVEYLLIGLSVLFCVTQVFWFFVVERLTSKLMARDYTEFKQFEVKPRKKEKPRPIEPDAEDARIANEANKMMGLI